MNYETISQITPDFIACGHRMLPGRIKAARKHFRLTQIKFANLIGISSRTLESWESGCRNPCGPAAALLYLAETQPEAFIKNRKKLLDQIKQLGLLL